MKEDNPYDHITVVHYPASNRVYPKFKGQYISKDDVTGRFSLTDDVYDGVYFIKEHLSATIFYDLNTFIRTFIELEFKLHYEEIKYDNLQEILF